MVVYEIVPHFVSRCMVRWVMDFGFFAAAEGLSAPTLVTSRRGGGIPCGCEQEWEQETSFK